MSTAGEPVQHGGPADGRELIRAELDAFLIRARTGPQALILEGDAGIGKTTVWREALQRADGLRVLVCTPTRADAALPYAGLADLLGDAADDALAALPEPQRQALEVALCRAAPGPDGVHAHAVFRGLLGALRQLAATSPVLLAVDDLPWLDPATAGAIDFVLRRLEEPVSLLATRRTDAGEAAPCLGLVTDLLHVGPLTLDEVDALVEQRLGHRFRLPALVQIHRSSSGNPLHAIEIARAALLTGADLHPGQPLPVPPDLASLLRSHLAQLPQGCARTLALLAALGQPSPDLLAAAVGSSRTAAAHVAAAQDAGVVARSGRRLRLAHPLFAEALLEDLGETERQDLHRVLAGVVPDAVERARHLALSTPHPDDALARVVDAGAWLASSRGAPAEAAQLAEQALRLTPASDKAARAARAVSLALHHEHTGTSSAVLPVLTRVLAELDPGPGRVPLLLRLAAAANGSGDGVQARQRYAQALREAGDEPDALAEVSQILGWELAATGRVAEALEHARTCAAVVDRVREPLLASGCRTIHDLVTFMAGDGRPAQLAGWTSPDVTGGTGSFPDAIHPVWAAAIAATWADDFPAARDAAEALRRWAQERGDPLGATEAEWLEGMVDQRQGLWSRASARAYAELERASRVDRLQNEPLGLWFLSLVEAHLGEVEQARAHAEAGLARSRVWGQHFAEVQCLAVLGFLELSLDDPRAAWERLAPLPDRLHGLGFGEPGFLRCTADAVEAAVAAGDLAEAVRLLDRFDLQVGRSGSRWGAAAAERCRGLLLATQGDPSAAVVLQHAVALHETLDQPFELARTLLVAGAAARRRKAKAAAAALLSRARELFEALPAPLWAARAEAEADRLGGRPAAPLTLTATERRVAAMAAQGMSNAEAAAALFVSVKTVEWNLSKVYRKTGVRSRAELAARWPLEV